MTSEDRLKCPKTTKNNLADIISWIQLGDCVVLSTCNGRYMAPYCKPGLENKNAKEYRTIYVDISNNSSLGDEGEWPWYILKEGAVLCDDEGMQRHILKECNPNTYYMSIS